MITRQRSISRDHDSIISLLSHAMNEEQMSSSSSSNNNNNNNNDYIDLNYDEFDELPVTRPSFNRSRSKTVSKLDFCLIQDNMIRCVCANIIAHIQKCENDHYIPPEEYKIFNKESGSLDYSLDSVSFVFTTVHRQAQMEFECIVIALIYLERIPRLTNKKLRICALNWRYLLFICMMLSSKIWDDFSMINADYSTIFSNLPLEKINLLEVHLLQIFNFSVEITTQEYYKMQKTIHDLNIAANKLRLHGKGGLKTANPSLSPSSSQSKFSISGRLPLQTMNNNSNNVIHNIDEETSFHLREKNCHHQIDEDSIIIPNEELLSSYTSNIQNTTDTIEEMTNSFTQDYFDNYGHIEEKRGYSNQQILTYSTKSLSQSIKDNSSDVSNEVNSISEGDNQINKNNNQEYYPDSEGNNIHPEVKDVCESLLSCSSSSSSSIKGGAPRRKTSIQLAVDNALLVLVKYLPMPSGQSAKIHITDEIV